MQWKLAFLQEYSRKPITLPTKMKIKYFVFGTKLVPKSNIFVQK